MLPEVGAASAHSMRTSVDLPEPFTPISATVSPRAMVNDRSSITARLAEG